MIAGPGLVGRGGAGEHEDAGADDGADAEQRQVPGRQAALERLASMFDVADELLDRLGLEQIRIHSASVDVVPPSRLCATADSGPARCEARAAGKLVHYKCALFERAQISSTPRFGIALQQVADDRHRRGARLDHRRGVLERDAADRDDRQPARRAPPSTRARTTSSRPRRSRCRFVPVPNTGPIAR